MQNPYKAVRKLAVLWLFCFAGGGPLLAQDMHLSQQYAGRLFLNPAFAGAQGDMRAVASYRNQWPALNPGFVTNLFSADYRFKEQGSAVGLAVAMDKAGEAGFSRLQVGAIYAYHLRVSENFTFSGGLQGSYGSQRLDFSALVFGDQLGEDGQVRNPSAEVNVYDPVSFLTVSAGGLLYNNAFWFGAAAHHLNQPDIGFTGLSELPLRLVANTGYKFTIHSSYEDDRLHEFSLTPTITYTRQGEFQKTDLALYTTYAPLTLGVLYRGVSFGQAEERDKTVAAMAGISIKSLRFGYSYDLPVGGFGAQAGGAHEISLTFEKLDYEKFLKKRTSRKNYNQIACPAF